MSFLPGFREETIYKISNLKTKTVVLFLAQTDMTPKVREGEISDYVWMEADEAKRTLNSDYGIIIDKAQEYKVV